jgi:hypothetical protein
MVILSCLNGSEMEFIEEVIDKSEMPSTDILQDNQHAILMFQAQSVNKQQWT